MSIKTEYYVNRVKKITKEILKLRQEREKIIKGMKNVNRENYESDDYWYTPDIETAVNDDRKEKLNTLDAKIHALELELHTIKYAALLRATKLSPYAKKLGFVSNSAYADYEADHIFRMEGHAINLASEEEFSLDTTVGDEILYMQNKMSDKEANKISRRGM